MGPGGQRGGRRRGREQAEWGARRSAARGWAARRVSGGRAGPSGRGGSVPRVSALGLRGREKRVGREQEEVGRGERE